MLQSTFYRIPSVILGRKPATKTRRRIPSRPRRRSLN